MSRIDILNQQVPTIAIVGTGLLGGSIGLGLRAAGFEGRIIGVGRRTSTVRRAADLGCVDEGTTNLGAAVERCSLIVLATPLGRFCSLLRQIAAHDHDALIITDVGSTKQQVCAEAHQVLPAPSRFVGSHPMAGSEQRGAEAARSDLFQGKPCIITPQRDTDPGAVQTVETVWSVLGMRLMRMTAKQHDQQTAVISHLPHATAVLLIQIASQLGGYPIASTGFRDTTRLASSNPPMRADVMMANRDQILYALDALSQHVQDLRCRLADGDVNAVRDLLNRARQSREDWLQQS